MGDFKTNLRHGKIGESLIARYLMTRGNHILPVYEKEIDEGKGPQFFSGIGRFAAPDLYCFPGMVWVEAKHKTVFTWHRNTQRWVTGVDLHHYEHYKRVEHISRRTVWIFFLHERSRPDDRDLGHGCPPECPTGLYCGRLSYLVKNENHKHGNHGRYGMVYWAEAKLRKIATLADVSDAAPQELIISPTFDATGPRHSRDRLADGRQMDLLA